MGRNEKQKVVVVISRYTLEMGTFLLLRRESGL